MVRHGHFQVNGKRVNIPSFLVKPGDVIEVREGSKQEPDHPARAETQAAASMTADDTAPTGRSGSRADQPAGPEQLIVEPSRKREELGSQIQLNEQLDRRVVFDSTSRPGGEMAAR